MLGTKCTKDGISGTGGMGALFSWERRIFLVLPNYPAGFADPQSWPGSQPSSPRAIPSVWRWQWKQVESQLG